MYDDSGVWARPQYGGTSMLPAVRRVETLLGAPASIPEALALLDAEIARAGQAGVEVHLVAEEWRLRALWRTVKHVGAGALPFDQIVAVGLSAGAYSRARIFLSESLLIAGLGLTPRERAVARVVRLADAVRLAADELSMTPFDAAVPPTTLIYLERLTPGSAAGAATLVLQASRPLPPDFPLPTRRERAARDATLLDIPRRLASLFRLPDASGVTRRVPFPFWQRRRGIGL